MSITDDLSYDDFVYAYDSDSFGTIDDSLNMDDTDEGWSHIDYSDNDVISEVMPMDNMFDYGSDAMTDNMSLDS